MRSVCSTRTLFYLLRWWLHGLLLACVGTVAADPAALEIRSLAALQNLTATNAQVIASVSLTGVVFSANAESRLLALRDYSAIALLELPRLASTVRAGDVLKLEATQILLAPNDFGVRVGTAPVVEIDDMHPPVTRSGRIFLTSGWQPLRLEWFNGAESGELRLSYEGPGVPLQSVPNEALRCPVASSPGAQTFQAGLQFAAYAGTNWISLPDFRTLSPVATGTVANIDLGERSQVEQVALLFSGSLYIPHSGVHTFHLTSDDGGRLFIGDPVVQCDVAELERASPLPTAKALGQALAEGNKQEWVAVEGKVTFASRHGNRVEMEIVNREQRVSVLVVSSAGLPTTHLVDHHVRATGVYQWQPASRTPRVVVPGASNFDVTGISETTSSEEPITTAAQVRRLQPDEARHQLPAAIRGVVTTAGYRSCVLQDATGPVFVSYPNGTWPHQPVVGELWEVEGVTDPGDFSPVVVAASANCLGKHALPQPIHPSWEQLINGSMDVELVELPGIVLEATPAELTLLTHGGKVTIVSNYEYPLPYETLLITQDQRLVGSRVSVRGVFFAYWEAGERQLVPGRFLLGDGVISVEEPMPDNVFALPVRRVTDLLRFTTHADVLTRFKVTGQVVHARPQECFLLDGANGFRVKTSEPVSLTEGDLVEAVGFPQLDGPSPVLLEAVVRKTGVASLPASRPLSVFELPNEDNDSTLVQVRAQLLSSASRLSERVLELQAGPHFFLARLRTAGQPFARLRPGAQLQLTGVYACHAEGEVDTRSGGFELLLNDAADIVVLKPGPWWTRRHTFALFAVLLTGLAMSLIWATMLRRTVAHRTLLLEKEIHQREQLEQRRLLEAERARVAHDLHDELGAGLAQISLMGSLAQRSNTQADRSRGLLSQITDKSREMVAALDEIVWAVNPTHDTATSVKGYLSDYAQEFLQPTGMICRLGTDSLQSEQSLTSTQRHQVFLAFKEAMTNIVKHARATEVWIRISTTAEGLCIIVEDNGSGISSPLKESSGHGIVSMRARLDQVGGSCEINSRPNGGTIVSFHLPVNK